MDTTTEPFRGGTNTEQRFRPSDFLVALAGVLVLCVLAAAAASAASPPQTAPGAPLDPRTYAPKSKLFLVAHASGAQRYTCQATGTWLFTDPVATLFKANGAPKPKGTHFLNFATGRPVWQWKDGSSVEAARHATQAVGTADIPWLLLKAVATTDGDGSDDDRLTETAWVQRLNTHGGVAPAAPCTPGAQRDVDYTADYFFWRAKGNGDTIG